MDQFDEVLTEPFENAKVQERVKQQGATNFLPLEGLDLATLPDDNFSRLSASGTVNDVIRQFFELGPASAQAVVNATLPVPVNPTKVFPRDFGGLRDPFVGSFELKFFVDVQELQGTTSRVRTITNNVETVTNTVVGGK